MKYAIIGTGFIFPKHQEAIEDVGGKIIQVVDDPKDPDAWKKVINSINADCAVILTPSYLHYPMAIAAHDAGKIVLSEKPLAIRSADVKDLMKLENIFVVQQLRYHPEIIKLKSEIFPGKNYNIEINISVHRDQHYFDSWKGDMEKSGGPLFTMGVHYFELLLYLFGAVREARMDQFDGMTGKGQIKGTNYDCSWRISVAAPRGENKRFFNVDGKPINLVSDDNLHRFVYKDLLQGKGVSPSEVLPVVELIEKLYADYKQKINP